MSSASAPRTPTGRSLHVGTGPGEFIHAAPASKLFAFGGDTGWPTSSVAYAIQARRWLARALQGEIDDSLLTEAEAIELATRFMRGNQEACFDLAGTRQALRVSAAG